MSILGALYSIFLAFLGIGAAFVLGFPNWREAVDYARCSSWFYALAQGAIAALVFGFAAVSFFNLSAMLVIGAVVVERGVMP